MVTEELQRAARLWLEDYDRRGPGQTLRDVHTRTPSEAYEFQGEVARLRERRGEAVVGFKVGCTSRPIREQLGIDGPIFGRLFDTECHRSGVRLSHARYANLAVEGELAVRLSRDLDGSAPLSAEDCAGAIDAVFPVIELHHFALPGAGPPGPELIAHNGMQAGFVLGERSHSRPVRPAPPSGLTIRIGGVVVDSAENPGDLVDPFASLVWLAGRLAGFGLRLLKGHVILTGSPLRLHPVAPGSEVVVEAPPLGECRAEIVP